MCNHWKLIECNKKKKKWENRFSLFVVKFYATIMPNYKKSTPGYTSQFFVLLFFHLLNKNISHFSRSIERKQTEKIKAKIHKKKIKLLTKWIVICIHSHLSFIFHINRNEWNGSWIFFATFRHTKTWKQNSILVSYSLWFVFRVSKLKNIRIYEWYKRCGT